jgi:hypothetical protein
MNAFWVTLQKAPHIEAAKIGNKIYVRGEIQEFDGVRNTLWATDSVLLQEKLSIPKGCKLKTENLSFGKHENKSFFIVELSV